jgi:hypothetical protein
MSGRGILHALLLGTVEGDRDTGVMSGTPHDTAQSRIRMPVDLGLIEINRELDARRTS